ncbi:MAG TPA: hypothetical protein VHW73_09505 [Rudaea sp.]|jgi:hypothetical protein|nr:hypothetical protein [Rudaea sp.]
MKGIRPLMGFSMLATRVLLVWIVALGVADQSSWSAQASAPCSSAQYRAFDFWVGDWTVRTADGKVVGHNKIDREYGGCVVHEHYTTDRGYSGESLNIYDAARGVWHQSWVDNSGLLLTIEGGVHDGKMVMEGQSLGKDGKPSKQRITWTPNADGTVRQLWESTDAKGSWTTAFDGVYSRQ